MQPTNRSGETLNFWSRGKANRELWARVSHPSHGPSLTAERTEKLIARGADVNADMPDHFSPLSHVSVWGNIPVARVLLKHGADPNGGSPDSNLPLVIAAQNGYEELVELLLEKGADLNARDAFGGTALHAAIISNTGRRSSVPELLVERGIAVDAVDDSGYTAFMRLWQQANSAWSVPPMGSVTPEMQTREDEELASQLARFSQLLE